MKNLFKSMMAIAVAAMSFASCSTDITEDIAPVEKFTVKINAVSPESRTVFGDIDGSKYPTLWEGTETIKATLNYSDQAKDVAIDAVSGDKKTATFKEVTFTDDESNSYTVYAVSPKAACVSGINSYLGWNLEVPSTQNPSATSCDATAQVLVGKSEVTNTVPTTVNIPFKHFTAYAKISFTNVVNLGDATVNSISIESEKDIAGRYKYYVADNGTNEADTFTSNTATKTITVNTSTLANIWVALAPADVSETKLTFTINTTAGTLTKTVTMPENRKFESGKVSVFNVNMSDISLVSPVKYELVTDPSILAVGDDVIIAAANYDFAMSTNQKTNNRSNASVVKDGNFIVDPAVGVEIFKLGKGSVTNTYTFQGADGKYIYAASSDNNHLKSQTSNNKNGMWTIDIDNGGIATILAQGTYTRNYMQYNHSSNLFACYTPTSSYQSIALYYKSNGGEKIAIEPQISANDVTGISYEGVTNATLPVVIRGISGTVTVTPDGTIVTSATLNNNVVTYSVAENTGSTTRTGTITLSNGTTSHTVNVEQGKPVTVTLPYSETFESSQGDWTIKNVAVGSLEFIWSYNSYKYMKATGHQAGSATESWLISPMINLAAATAPELTFDHTHKFAGTPAQELTVWATADNGANWEQLTIPTYAANTNWTFVSSGAISLTKYVGKTIKIAYKYVSTEANAATWEIKNVVVKEAE